MNNCPNCGTQLENGATFCPNCGTAVGGAQPQQAQMNQQYVDPNMAQNPGTVYPNQGPVAGGNQKSKLVAGLLAIFLGSFGVHNFYLGNTKKAVTQLLLTLIAGPITCGIAAIGVEVWGLVEGIQILTGSINTDANGIPLKD